MYPSLPLLLGRHASVGYYPLETDHCRDAIAPEPDLPDLEALGGLIGELSPRRGYKKRKYLTLLASAARARSPELGWLGSLVRKL